MREASTRTRDKLPRADATENTCLEKLQNPLPAAVIYAASAARFTSEGIDINRNKSSLCLRLEHRSRARLIKAFSERDSSQETSAGAWPFRRAILLSDPSSLAVSRFHAGRPIAAVRLYNVMGINNTASRSNPRGMHNARTNVEECNVHYVRYIGVHKRARTRGTLQETRGYTSTTEGITKHRVSTADNNSAAIDRASPGMCNNAKINPLRFILFAVPYKKEN